MERTVLDRLLAVLEPAALSATAQALAEADAHCRQRLAAFETAVERAVTRPTGGPPPPVRRG